VEPCRQLREIRRKTMYFKPYYLGCLAHASYLLGGDNGEAVVIDPRRDVEEYLADAKAAGLKIRYVLETHLHADFVSGHLELAQRTGATIYLGAATPVSFPHIAVHEGDTLTLGDVTLRFIETPGHTPEGISILAYVGEETEPKMVFTGDTLFIGDVGRPDLAGWRGHGAEEQAHAMYHTLKEKLLTLPETTEVWPAHGAGSACGRALSDERVSTIGREKTTDPALQTVLAGDEEGFVRALMAGQSAMPGYFPHDVMRNKEGAESVEEVLARGRALTPAQVEVLSEKGTLVLDTRTASEFGAGHVPGAVNIGLEGKFAPWVGNVLNADSPVILVTAPGQEEEAMTRLIRIGYENITGWLEGGMAGWKAAGGEVVTLPQMTAQELRQKQARKEAPQVLDVRANEEWEAGHMPDAKHIPLPELEQRMGELTVEPLIVMCGSGYRSSIASSLLQRNGRHEITNLTGGWAAWTESGAETGKKDPDHGTA
jgi:hydroxyacylglutathione hydrolase